MSTELQLIVDDDSAAFAYSWSGGSTTTTSPWALGPSILWYNSRSWHCSVSSPGILIFTFNGTSAAFIGSINAFSPILATVQIDNGTPFSIDYGEPISPPTYKQWFVTPTLPDGSHRITISNLLGAAIDYAVVKVGNQTSLTGQTVIVDDDSPLIQYYGRWSRNTEKFDPDASTLTVVTLTGYPYGNGTHRSSNPGDSFTFRFTGTYIVVYGMFSFNTIGVLTTSFSVDGQIYTKSYEVNASTPEYANGIGEIPNYLYFGVGGLPSGTHTFLFNITGANNKEFVLDYITYTPSFDTLSSMPSLSSSISGGTGSSTSPPSATPTASGSQKSVSTGAIVGGVVGGVAFGALLMLLVISILRRRKAREPNYDYNDANLNTS